MADKARLDLVLYVDDQGSLRVREFSDNAEKNFQRVETSGVRSAGAIGSAWEKLSGVWLKAIGAIVGLRSAWDSANMAAQAQQEEVAFRNMAASYGANADRILADLKRVSSGTVDTMTLVRSAGTAMMMGIDPTKVSALMEIAAATAKLTGQTVTQAFSDISLAVGRQSKMILDNLGIIVSVEKANEEYAASLGKTSNQLTDAEKKQAFMNATLKAGGELMDKLGRQQDTAADRLQRWKANWIDATHVMGNAVLSVAMATESAFAYIGAGFNSFISSIASGNSRLLEFGSKIPIVGGLLKEGAKASRDFANQSEMAAQTGLKHSAELWQTIIDLWQNGDEPANKMLGNIQAQRDALAAVNEEQKKLTEAYKAAQKEAEEKAKTEREMYQEIGVGAEAYYQQEATKLIEKAARWKEVGGDIVTIETWLYDQLGALSQKAQDEGQIMAATAMTNLQYQYRTLIDEFFAVTNASMTQLQQLGMDINALDGSQIKITASLDGSSLISQVDAIIAKLQQLQATSASAIAMASAAQAASASGSDSGTGADKGGSASRQIVAPTTADKSGVTIINNLPGKWSRQDVVDINSEQKRRLARA